MKLSKLPIGSKIKFGKYSVETESPEPIIWLVADQNHEGYPNNSTTLLTEGIIDFRAFDAAEPDNPNVTQKKYGSNDYSVSNIRQWLNSNKLDWYSPQHKYDASPTNERLLNNDKTGYDDHSGFLYNFTEEEMKIIKPTNLKLINANDGTLKTLTDLIFLFSVTETNLINENNLIEGSKIKIFSDNDSRISNVTLQVKNNSLSKTKLSWYWLRTPILNEVSILSSINMTGELSRIPSNWGEYGVRPALNLSSEISISNTLDEDGCYNIILKPQTKYINYKKK